MKVASCCYYLLPRMVQGALDAPRHGPLVRLHGLCIWKSRRWGCCNLFLVRSRNLVMTCDIKRGNGSGEFSQLTWAVAVTCCMCSWLLKFGMMMKHYVLAAWDLLSCIWSRLADNIDTLLIYAGPQSHYRNGGLTKRTTGLFKDL